MKVFTGKVKQSAPKVNLQAMNLNEGHRLFLFFLMGILLGTLLLNLFFRDYASKIGVYNEYFVNGVNMYATEVNKTEFFIFCIKRYMGEFVIILLFNLTPIGMLFNRIYCIYRGVVIAMLISSATLTYGIGGIVIYILSIFPHYIMYVPFVIVSIYISTKVAEKIKEHKIRKIKLRVVIVIIALAIFTSLLEAYINYPILKIAFSDMT